MQQQAGTSLRSHRGAQAKNASAGTLRSRFRVVSWLNATWTSASHYSNWTSTAGDVV
jgi:hypothetical protein